MKYHWILVVFFTGLTTLHIYSQPVILGGSGSPKIKVTTSDQWTQNHWQDSASGQKVIDGSGLIFDEMVASRFLYQAGFGANQFLIKQVASQGIEVWLEQQQNLPVSSLTDILVNIHKDVSDWHFKNGGDSTNLAMQPNFVHFNYAWWTMNHTKPDVLRQRIAFALSELFVVSQNSNFEGMGLAGSTYYDLLLKNSFGNFRDLLTDVTLSVSMGSYLSHLNNPKSIPDENINPDENYAREIMQLFTIGLFELNLDGSYKLDSAGNKIPTYNQRDVQELAKVFTGLGLSAVVPNEWIDTASFGINVYFADLTKPMRMYENWHEPGIKTILNEHIIPSGQAGMKDISDALDILFNHSNVGPFISKQLIQRLIKSNPSPDYIERIARVFNNDGNGIRGNLKAVVKAILLDDEARTCDWLLDDKNGQLREPILRYAHFLNAMQDEHYYNRYWNQMYDFYQNTGQMPLAAPTVFNFFTPNYSPNGELKKANLVAPEFQIHNSKTSIGYINLVNNWTIYDTPFYSWERNDPSAYLNIDELKKVARDPEVLVNQLDMLFTHGNMSDRTRGIIKQTIQELINGDFRNERVRLAIYLTLISPDYAIFK